MLYPSKKMICEAMKEARANANKERWARQHPYQQAAIEWATALLIMTPAIIFMIWCFLQGIDHTMQLRQL